MANNTSNISIVSASNILNNQVCQSSPFSPSTQRESENSDKVYNNNQNTRSTKNKLSFLYNWIIPYDQTKAQLGFSCIKRFHRYWQAIFNRRIRVINGYPLQIGDLFFFIGFWVIFLIQFISFQEVPDCKNQGNAVAIIMLLTCIFGCRNGLLNNLFGVSLERAILWHKFLGWSTLILSINLWIHSEYSLTGVIMEIPILGLVAFSIVPLRRRCWEFFIKFHWILIIFLFFASILHKIIWGYVGVSLFFIDVFIRIFFATKYSKIQNTFSLERIGNDLVRVTIPLKGQIFYKGGQYFFLMIPKLTYFQWHPFSACSASYQDNLIFYVKTLGDWTNCLYQIAGEEGNPTTVKGYMDGPYGNQSISIEDSKYQHFLFISGGIGITPIISTAKELIYQKQKGRPLKSIHFIWTTRDQQMVLNILQKQDLFDHMINNNDDNNNYNNNNKNKNNINNEQKDIVKTFYHLTQKNNKERSNDLQNMNGVESKRIEFIEGRPNFFNYFNDTFNLAKDSNSKFVAVLVCGPENLINQIEYLAEQYSKNGIRFDVHQDVFQF